jgi:hypothetical protein
MTRPLSQRPRPGAPNRRNSPNTIAGPGRPAPRSAAAQVMTAPLGEDLRAANVSRLPGIRRLPSATGPEMLTSSRGLLQQTVESAQRKFSCKTLANIVLQDYDNLA